MNNSSNFYKENQTEDHKENDCFSFSSIIVHKIFIDKITENGEIESRIVN